MTFQPLWVIAHPLGEGVVCASGIVLPKARVDLRLLSGIPFTFSETRGSHWPGTHQRFKLGWPGSPKALHGSAGTIFLRGFWGVNLDLKLKGSHSPSHLPSS